MDSYELRPLSLGELLDRTFTLYRRNFWLFAGIMIFPIFVNLPIQFAILRAQGAPYPIGRPSAPPARELMYVFAFLPLLWLFYAVAQAAITYAVSETYLGRSANVAESYRKIRGRVWRVIGVSVSVGIRVFALLILVLILVIALPMAAIMPAAIAARGGGSQNAATLGIIALVLMLVLAPVAIVFVLWFSVRYSVSIPALLLENIKGRAAIRRSIELSRGRRGQGLLAILLSLVVTYAMVFLFQGPFYAAMAMMKIKGQLPVWLILSMSASSSIGAIVAGPLPMIIFVVFYYDLRIRKEAFDLQQMMASLPQPTHGGAVAPA